MKRTLSAKFENGIFKPLPPGGLSLREGSIVAITFDDTPPKDDPGWMKRILDDEEAERYLNSVSRETAA